MPADEPEQSYYPSARVRLIIRLEDFGNPKVPSPPKKPAQIRRGVGRTKDADLTVTYDNGIWVLLGKGDDPNHLGSPQQQQASSDNLTHVVDGIIPSRATLRRNGMRTASTLSLTLPFVDLPLDPRCVRAVAVQYYLGCVTAADYQAGIRGEVRTDASSNSVGLALHVVPDKYVDGFGRARDNLRFEGWVDEWEALFPENDANEVQIECTDNTRLVLEQDAPPRLSLEPKVRIDQAIANYLANFPQFRGLSVAYAPKIDVSQIPKLGAALGKTAFQPHLGPPPAGAGGAGGAGGAASKLKVWDYLTDMCAIIGHNIRMVGTTLVVQRPRTLYDARFEGRDDDSFTGRRLPSGRVLTRRLYVYGHNLTELKIKRKFTTYVPRNVEIRSYDPAHKRTIVVRYPANAKDKRQTKPQPGDANEQSWWVISRPGIRDEKTARLVAQSIYEFQGRNELEVRFLTKNLASFGGGNLDPDALDVLPGDPIDVEVQRQADGTAIPNTVADIQSQMQTRPQEFLKSLGYSDKFAKAYATAIQSVGLPTTFRCKTVGIDWDMESSGVSIDFEAMNYIEVRANQDLESDEQITPDQVQTAASGAKQPTTVNVNEER